MREQIAMAALALAYGPAMAAADDAQAMAVERGCTTCHAERPAREPGAAPLAPSWREIADRNRGKPGAEEALAAIVVGGSGERHWKRTAFAGMLPNEVEVTPAEARTLVRWILERR